MSDPLSLLARMSAANVAEVAQQTPNGVILWRVRKIAPGEAVKLGVVEGLMGAAIAKADPPKLGRMAGSEDPSIKQASMAITMFDAVARVAVTGIRVEGGEWVPVKLVSPDDEDVSAGLLAITAISNDVIGLIMQAAVAGAQGAGDTVATFPGGAT